MEESLALGGIAIPFAAALLSLGLILGLAVTWLEGKRRFHNGGMALDLGMWTVLGGFASGWVGYVLTNWSDVSKGWDVVLETWQSSRLVFPAAFLGGLLATGLFAVLRREGEGRLSFWELADMLTPGLASGASLVWAVSLALGATFGYALLPNAIRGAEVALDSIWAYYFYKEAPLYLAVQGVGIALALGVGLAFWLLRKRWSFAGAACLAFALIYFGGQSLLESVAGIVQGGQPLSFGPWQLAQSFPWQIGQVLDLALAWLAAAGLLALWHQAHSRRVEPTMIKRAIALATPLAVGLVGVSLVAAALVSTQARAGGSLNKVFFPEPDYSKVARITPKEAKDKAEKGQALLVDVRSPEEYAYSHAAGAISLAEHTHGADGEEIGLADQIDKLPRDKVLILYCA